MTTTKTPQTPQPLANVLDLLPAHIKAALEMAKALNVTLKVSGSVTIEDDGTDRPITACGYEYLELTGDTLTIEKLTVNFGALGKLLALGVNVAEAEKAKAA